jgi:N utilization substance protein B
MKRRSKARECALQMLYQMELTQTGAEAAAREFWGRPEAREAAGADLDEVRAFADDLVRRVTEKGREIDGEIEACAEHWKMDRMAVVDRNILRIGTCEILYVSEVPSKVAINEAIELAKRFGDAESSRFVNGILDKIAKRRRPCEDEKPQAQG